MLAGAILCGKALARIARPGSTLTRGQLARDRPARGKAMASTIEIEDRWMTFWLNAGILTLHYFVILFISVLNYKSEKPIDACITEYFIFA